jgi:NAD(P)-dependent dehydrogenase (short-subunit alcohol dehydrogenase family)
MMPCQVFDLNVKGIYYLTLACIPMLEKAGTQDDPARIINIGSVVGMVPQEAPTYAYDASKAAVHNMTKKFAADLAPKCITGACASLELISGQSFSTYFIPCLHSQLPSTWLYSLKNVGWTGNMG